MNQYHDEFAHVEWAIWVLWAIVVLVASSGLYPAKKLYASAEPICKVSFRIITVLAFVGPIVIFAFDRLRLNALNGDAPGGLQNMPIPIEALPCMYLFSAAIAALFFWLVFAWHRRTAA